MVRLFLSDLLYYVELVLLAWWSTPLVALIAGGVAMIEGLIEKRLSKRVLIAFGIAYLFFAFFSIWRDQYRHTQELEFKADSARARFSTQHTDIQTLVHPTLGLQSF